MNAILTFWYRFSLPLEMPESSPQERERRRYARLTSLFLLISAVLFVPASPIMIFNSPRSPSSPPIAIAMLILLALSFLLGRWGRNYLSAITLVCYYMIAVTGPIATNPLDPSLLPLFSAYAVTIILAGSLLPPYAALIVGAISCILVIVFPVFAEHSPAYDEMIKENLYTISILLPIFMQLVVSAIIFVIMRHLLVTIRRADRAEEIIQLQKEIADFERKRSQEKDALEAGLHNLAETHARIANGDLNARVALDEGNVLWSVAVPLNNLLNRLQRLKTESDELTNTKHAALAVADALHRSLRQGRIPMLPNSGTPLDTVIIELNKVASGHTYPLSYPPKNSFFSTGD